MKEAASVLTPSKMAHKRWRGTTKAQRQAHALKMVAAKKAKQASEAKA